MIKFSDEVYFDKFFEHKLGKERLRKLEKALRVIGTFDGRKPIIITEGNTHDYMTKDSNQTVFEFDEYSVGEGKYCQNFYLYGTEKDSNITYTYDFSKIPRFHFSADSIELIEISYQLKNDRYVTFDQSHLHFSRLEVLEKDKRYLLGFYKKFSWQYDVSKEEKKKIVEKIESLENLSLENLIDYFGKKNIDFSYVYKDYLLLASIHFKNGEVKDYKILQEDGMIYGNFLKENRERKIGQEVISNNLEEMQEDVKRLLKK